MPRFVVLAHDHPQPHFDFMLEVGEVLKTWRLDAVPSALAQQSATSLPDHRLAYLDYEGPVSGNRGHVQRVDRGEYFLLHQSESQLDVSLAGAQFNGRARLSRIGEQWQFEWLANPS